MYDRIASARERREVVLRREDPNGPPAQTATADRADAVFQRYLAGGEPDPAEALAISTKAKVSRRQPVRKIAASTSLFPAGAPSVRDPATSLADLQERARETLVAQTGPDEPRKDNHSRKTRRWALLAWLAVGFLIGLAFLVI